MTVRGLPETNRPLINRTHHRPFIKLSTLSTCRVDDVDRLMNGR